MSSGRISATAPGPVARAASVAWIAALAASLYGLPLLRLAANRLVTGEPVYAFGGVGSEVGVTLALAAAAVLLARRRGRIAGASAAFLLVAAAASLGLGLGTAAADHLAGRPPAARASLAAGAWLGLALLVLGMAGGAGRSGLAWLGPAALALLAGLFGLGLHGGALDALSLVVEFRARRDGVVEAFGQHLVLVGSALALAILATVALRLWRAGRSVVGDLVAGLQVVPALALLGALVAALSALLHAAPALRGFGLSALGAPPAILGVAAYLLLPLWRGLDQALAAPDPATLDAARALGLTRGQTLARVRLPVGAPVLVGALRVAAVQAVGLATLGALIGAGGLGTIVFEGMAQFAPDLILLGALPVVGLGLLAEGGLARLERLAGRLWA